MTDANNNTTNFSYDDFDRLITTSYPATAAPSPPQAATTETFTYDDDGNIVERRSRADEKFAYDYDGLNRLILRAVPGGQVISYSYDLAGRLTSVGDNSAAIVPAVSPTGSTVTYATTFTYDALNRPTGVAWDPAPAATAPAAGPLVTFGHSYDRTNRRIGQTVDDNTWLAYPTGAPSTTSYAANALNQYSAVTGLTPSYNANGNLTGDGTYTYGYDAENRLVSASGAGNTASYAYDGRGWRKRRTVNGTTTISVTDADNREVLEYDGSTGAILRWYAYGLGPNDVLNQMSVSGGTRSVLLPDLQGSIIAAFSPADVLAKSAYLPFGGSAAPANPFAYTGQRIEPEAGGAYYYRARHYSTVFGRFLQVDPVGYSAGSNLYAYVVNDPLNLVDPSGLVVSSPSSGQNLAQGTTNLIPGDYNSGLAQQQYQEGNYWPAAASTESQAMPQSWSTARSSQSASPAPGVQDAPIVPPPQIGSPASPLGSNMKTETFDVQGIQLAQAVTFGHGARHVNPADVSGIQGAISRALPIIPYGIFGRGVIFYNGTPYEFRYYGAGGGRTHVGTYFPL